LGAVTVDPLGFDCYRALVKHIYQQQTFRSVLTSMIVSSGKGEFGFVIPEDSGGRVKRTGQAFVWPLMSMLFAFDVVRMDGYVSLLFCVKFLTSAISKDCVANRSQIVQWIKDCDSVSACHGALGKGRKSIQILGEENFPLHTDMTAF
jgi:hypothetical protein